MQLHDAQKKKQNWRQAKTLNDKGCEEFWVKFNLQALSLIFKEKGGVCRWDQ